jgi:hypothetical protein
MQSPIKLEAEGQGSRKRSFLITALLLLVGLLALSTPLLAQVKKPISKDGLIKAIQLNGLSTRELIEQIQIRGVEFQMTPQIETELRNAGARPEVIEAARANYRSVANAGRPTPGRNTPNVPAGPPLSKNEIITLLQSGAASTRVEQFVQVRGVNFTLTPQITREITSAGGSRSLIGLIAGNGPNSARRTQPTHQPAPPVRRGPDYDELTDQATAAFKANNADGALNLLQQAIRLDGSRPTAYQLTGFVELYGKGDIVAAERNMRAAIERGGSAAFRVFHDHADGFFTSTCSGSLFITKTNVTYKADDGHDTFEANDSDIKEIKTNSFVGSDRGAFHIKVKRERDSRNYNFAPLTKKKDEAKLIIALVKGYQGPAGQ